MRHIDTLGDFDRWRTAARGLLHDGVPPEAVAWSDGRERMLPISPPPDDNVRLPPGRSLRVPRSFLQQADRAAAHCDPGRWALLYRVLWRLTRGGERMLLEDAADADVHRLQRLVRQVGRDVHKTKAFVRFRRISDAAGERYVAWHRPDHRILRLAAPFFVRRFGVLRWTIFAPTESADWDGDELRFGLGVPRRDVVTDDALDELWRTYYAAIFNPARIKLAAMKREMPVRHWQTLPEADVIDQILRDAPRRVAQMVAHQGAGADSAELFLPPGPTRSLPQLAAAAVGCEGCELHAHASQVVFGEGPPDARIVLVGEQPGDVEDEAGRPFVGPAGQVLDEALRAAGLRREALYLTNTVKHFRWEPRGKRRLHRKPGQAHVRACRPWLEAEMEAIRPEVVVCLGSTAAQALLGVGFRVTQERGRLISGTRWAPHVLATIHPSAVLRMPAEQQAAGLAGLIEDLRVVADCRTSTACV